MLPAHRLLALQSLYSGRQQTFYTPETLFLSIGLGQPVHAEDNSIATLVHEGVHWRQFQGTTFGAFCQWVKHSQEVNTYQHFRELPTGRKRELLAARAGGVPILGFDRDTSLPQPAISGADLRDRANLIRTIWFDHLFTYRYFRDSSDVQFHPAPAEEIFASVIADAAVTLTVQHPRWADISYSDVQNFYKLKRIGKVTALGKELGTKDLLEAAAAANEVFFQALIMESRYSYTAEEAERALREGELSKHERGSIPALLKPYSILGPRDSFDGDVFRGAAGRTLKTSYGYALRCFFQASGLPPERAESWMTALAVIDFALNGPLPPLVPPGRTPPRWEELYPPARFLDAAFAARRCRTLRLNTAHDDLVQFFGQLASAVGTGDPMDYSLDNIVDAGLPDFEVIKRGPVFDNLLETTTSYYSFLRWCQQSLWTLRMIDATKCIVPIPRMWSQFGEIVSFAFAKLGYTAPLVLASDGEIEHSLGSTTQFGTWLALSTLVHHASWEVMVGIGKPEFRGFPVRLMTDEVCAQLIDSSIRRSLGVLFDPWQPDSVASGNNS